MCGCQNRLRGRKSEDDVARLKRLGERKGLGWGWGARREGQVGESPASSAYRRWEEEERGLVMVL